MNNEQKKSTEARYHVLIKTHREMNVHVEKLEKKLKHFQERYQNQSFNNSRSLSRDYSISSNSQFISEFKSLNLSVCGPLSIFSN